MILVHLPDHLTSLSYFTFQRLYSILLYLCKIYITILYFSSSTSLLLYPSTLYSQPYLYQQLPP